MNAFVSMLLLLGVLLEKSGRREEVGKGLGGGGGLMGTNTKDESQSKTESQFKLSLETVGKRTKMGLKR